MMASSALLLFALKVVTLADAEKQALARQPSILSAEAQTEAARAREDEALAPLLPQLAASGLYQRSTANFAPAPGSYPSNATPPSTKNTLDNFNYFKFALQANQLIWDFNYTVDRYRAAGRTTRSLVDTEVAIRQLALQTVRVAFFNARAARAAVAVQRATLANQQKHLGQIAGFVKVGTRPEIDLAQARTDVANARVQLINAENAYGTAKEVLNQAMGVEDDIGFDVSDEVPGAVAGEDGALASLLDEAMRGRPDVASALAQLRAQELMIRATKGNYWPTFAATIGLTAAGADVTNMAYNGVLSLTGNWGFYSGGLTVAQVREARANLAVIRAQIESLRLQVRLDVNNGRLAVVGAKAALLAAGEALENANERLRLAEGRYAAGVGSIIELGDAQVSQTTLANQVIQYEFNLAAARAQLLRALGRQ